MPRLVAPQQDPEQPVMPVLLRFRIPAPGGDGPSHSGHLGALGALQRSPPDPGPCLGGPPPAKHHEAQIQLRYDQCDPAQDLGGCAERGRGGGGGERRTGEALPAPAGESPYGSPQPWHPPPPSQRPPRICPGESGEAQEPAASSISLLLAVARKYPNLRMTVVRPDLACFCLKPEEDDIIIEDL
ncbi:Hypothetical predicted protein [Podarcis lilfordi]|uniref:Uncharacterized protein n=1 Tax=Podarcis lilfordi TaxID=74358 RepID=A0AA35LJY7_9SAUR|nr:Hypothetical predicted protein [Podarcis lilfordi]